MPDLQACFLTSFFCEPKELEQILHSVMFKVFQNKQPIYFNVNNFSTHKIVYLL